MIYCNTACSTYAGRGRLLPARSGQPLGGAHHAGAAPGVLGRIAVVGAGEHAGELRRGDPPRGQPDDHEHQVLGDELVVEDALALGGRVGPRLLLVVRGAVRLVGHRPPDRPSHSSSRTSWGWAAW